MKPFFYIASVSTSIALSFAAGFYLSGSTTKVKEPLMVNVPSIGYSRVETVNMCLQDAKVKVYQDLITDSQLDTFTTCLKDNT